MITEANSAEDVADITDSMDHTLPPSQTTNQRTDERKPNNMKIFTPRRCPLQALANHSDLPPAARDALADNTTIHYEIRAITAAHMIEDETPLPLHVRANVSWPHQVPTCIHYEPAIKLDALPYEQPDHAIMQGTIVIPQPDQNGADIITFSFADNTPHFQQNTIDAITGHVVPDDDQPYDTDTDIDESNRIVRYYTRLARHISRSLQAPATNPTGTTKKAVAYLEEAVRPGDTKQQLEEIITNAAKNPRPFDVTVIASRWMLGTEDEADNAIARLQEHGIKVEFADERIE